MTEDKKALLESELEHYRLLKKDTERSLSFLRKEFPDVPVKNILDKYRTKVNDHFTAHTAPTIKQPL